MSEPGGYTVESPSEACAATAGDGDRSNGKMSWGYSVRLIN